MSPIDIPDPKQAPLYTLHADLLEAAIRQRIGDLVPPYELLAQWLASGQTQEEILAAIDAYLAQAEAEARAQAAAAGVEEDWRKWAAHLVVVKGHGKWEEVYPPSQRLSKPVSDDQKDLVNGGFLNPRKDPDEQP